MSNAGVFAAEFLSTALPTSTAAYLLSRPTWQGRRERGKAGGSKGAPRGPSQPAGSRGCWGCRTGSSRGLPRPTEVELGLSAGRGRSGGSGDGERGPELRLPAGPAHPGARLPLLGSGETTPPVGPCAASACLVSPLPNAAVLLLPRRRPASAFQCAAAKPGAGQRCTAGKTCVSWNYTKASLQAPPLDFSFRGISFIQDLLTEEPRPGLRPIRRLEGGRLLTQAVRLNNNTLSDLTDFSDIMEKLLEYPLDIYWIDLSFNDLPNIDPVLTTFYNLRNLNLHGNSIQHLSEVDKLAVLPHLRNLTLHGNPIEEEKGYRSYVLSTLPQLKNFDFSGITKLDRSTAAVWRRMNIKPKAIRKKRERY